MKEESKSNEEGSNEDAKALSFDSFCLQGGIMMEELKYAIWISMVNIIPMKKYRLFQNFGSFKAIYEASKDNYLQIEDFDFIDLHELSAAKNEELIQKYMNYIHQNEIKVITINDEKYPHKLKEIFDPPLVLYAKGNLALLDKPSLAMVGSRQADNYGKKVAYEFAKEISSHDICVISGLATGIDSMSHLGAIRRNREYHCCFRNGS